MYSLPSFSHFINHDNYVTSYMLQVSTSEEISNPLDMLPSSPLS